MPTLIRCLVSVSLLFPLAASAQDLFEPPVRLKADGKVIDTGPAWGHSSPCFEDLDGDGLRDLLLGDFGGSFEIFRNVGTAEEPEFRSDGLLHAGGEPAKVRIYCCIGGQPRFCDLDGDGLRDMISNSYDPGHCYFFRGLPNHQFASMEEVVDRAGVPVRTYPVQTQNYQSFGSFFTPVDWDADGDVDLLIGCFQGELMVRINEGDAKNYKFAAENQTVRIGGEPLKVKAHFCPDVADWDGDGTWDIIAGSDDGSVTWFRNIGSEGEPAFEAGVVLVPPHDGNGYNLLHLDDEQTVPGIRSQVEVTDFNNDGKLDLLVGDFFTKYELKSNLTDEEKQKVKQLVDRSDGYTKAFADKLEALRAEFKEKYPGEEIFSEEADTAWSKAYQELRDSPEARKMEEEDASFTKEMRQYLAETRGQGDRSFDLAVSHGYVWLFQRK